MPYVYQNTQNPYAGTIGELLARSGDIRARAAESVGSIQARAQEQSGNAWAGAAQAVGQDVSGAIQEVNDPRRQLEQQQVEANKRTMAYTTTATKIAQGLTGPNGEQPDPDVAAAMLTKAGVPVTFQKDILASLTSMNDHHKESLADAGAVAYHLMTSLPKGATADDKAHAASAGLGAAVASGVVGKDDAGKILQGLGGGGDPMALVMGAMSQSPSGRYKDLIDVKPVVLAGAARPGASPASLVSPVTGDTLATGAQAAPERPPQPTVASLAVAANPNNPAAALAAAKSTPPVASAQTKSMMLDGKPSELTWNPKTEKWSDAAGVEITNPSARIKPMPPASIMVQNQIAAQAAAAPLVDASRPTGETANKIDPKTGMTPNAMFQAAVENALTAKMPQLGFGQSPISMAIRMGIQNKAAAIAAAAGTDIPTVQAEYRANSGALNKLLPIARATATFANTATDNLDLALSQSDQVARTGAKLANRYLQWAQGNLTPAAGLTKFETYVYTAAREYAKVTSGGAASAQGLTDSAQREASKLLNTAQSPEAFSAAVGAMKNDMANVVGEQAKTLNGISGTIASFFAAANGLPPPPAGAPARPAVMPPPQGVPAGRIRISNGKGQSGTILATDPIPDGWTKQ